MINEAGQEPAGLKAGRYIAVLALAALIAATPAAQTERVVAMRGGPSSL